MDLPPSYVYMITESDYYFNKGVDILNKSLNKRFLIVDLEDRKHFETAIKGFIATALSSPREKIVGVGLAVAANIFWDCLEKYNEIRTDFLLAQYNFELADFYNRNVLLISTKEHNFSVGLGYFFSAIRYVTYADILATLLPDSEARIHVSSYIKELRLKLIESFHPRNNLSDILWGYYENLGEVLESVHSIDAETAAEISEMIVDAGIYIEKMQDYYYYKFIPNFDHLCSQRVRTGDAPKRFIEILEKKGIKNTKYILDNLKYD